MRAETIALRSRAYVMAAQALGASHARVILQHILPGLRATLLVVGSHAAAQMILAEAVLSYLTVGIAPPTPTWGRMLHEVEHYIGSAPHLLAAPAIAILFSVLSFTRLGDGLRDAYQPQRAPLRGHRARLLVDVVVVAAAIVLAASHRPEPLAAPARANPTAATIPHRGGTLRLATSFDIYSLEPATAYNEAARNIDDLVFARLLDFDPQGTLTGALCERFEALENGTRLRLTLRPGVHFHDGAPLTAADVKRSLERSFHPRTPSPVASLYNRLRGLDAFRKGTSSNITGVVVVDGRTVEFQLTESDATFPALLSLAAAAPVCPSSGRYVDAKHPTPPCGAGPFRVTQHIAGERIVLQRFEHYYLPGRPYLNSIEWSLKMPARTQRYRFERGELDLLSEFTSAAAARYAHDKRFRGLTSWVTKPAVHGVFLNTEQPPFNNLHLRRAVAFALDPAPLSRVRSNIISTHRMLPPGVPRPIRHAPLRRHDLAQALKEMALAGYAYDPHQRSGGYPTPIDYLAVSDTFEQAAAELFQQQLAAVGLRLRLRLVSWGSWLSLVTTRGQAHMGWRGWAADFPDPANFFEPILTTAAIQPAGGQNVSFFSDPAFDALVARAHRETDPETRLALYGAAERMVAKQVPFIPLYLNRSLLLRQPYLRGYRPHPVVPLRLRDVWLARRTP